MSEFFKALEQAERDRAKEEQAEAASAAATSRTAPPENRKPEPVVARPAAARPAVTEPPAPKPVVPEPAITKPAAPEPVIAQRSVARPTPPEPVARPAAPRPAPAEPLVAKTTATPAQSVMHASSPASVFRPSLRTPPRGRVFGRNGRQPLLVALTDSGSVEAEAYRTLRANIELTSDGSVCRRIVITSAAGGDGKSTTAANLAVVAAQAGRRVCLVDGDLRRPTLHDVFGLPNVDGLALALEQGKPLQEVARPSDLENLSIVVAGRGADESSHDLLTSQRLERVVRDSEAAFDLVIVDGPPVVLADTLNVAAVCDGVVLVVRSGSIPFNVLRRTIAQVKQVNGRVLGVLLNRVDWRAADSGSYRSYRAYHKTGAKS
jgi:capsular exopolysaccharide synthesis family protein